MLDKFRNPVKYSQHSSKRIFEVSRKRKGSIGLSNNKKCRTAAPGARKH
jgi:hypothetical protein